MQRSEENIAIGKRLAEVQALYNKSDEYMASILDYAVHTYRCVLNGDQAISTKKLVLLSKDPQFSRELVYILSGNRFSVDYSVKGLQGYIEAMEPSGVIPFLSDIQLVISKMMIWWSKKDSKKR